MPRRPPTGGITPVPARVRVLAPAVLTPAAQALASYDVIVGWDTEYVGRTATDETSCNEIISYQFSVVWRDGGWYWLVEDIVYPPAGQRLSLAELVGHVLQACGIGYRRAARSQVLLVAHFGVAEWAALRDREHLASQHLTPIRKVPVSFGSFKLGVDFGHNHYADVSVTLRDTYLLAPAGMQSLDALSRVTTFKKVEVPRSNKAAMDAFLARDPVTFEAYAINDCRVTLEYYFGVVQTHEEMFAVPPGLPLTLGDVTVCAYPPGWTNTAS